MGKYHECLLFSSKDLLVPFKDDFVLRLIFSNGGSSVSDSESEFSSAHFPEHETKDYVCEIYKGYCTIISSVKDVRYPIGTSLAIAESIVREPRDHSDCRTSTRTSTRGTFYRLENGFQTQSNISTRTSVSFKGLTTGPIDVLEPKMSCRLNRLPLGFHIGVPVGPLFFLPTASAFSVAISAFCVAIFSRDVVRKWVLALDSS
nr:hypothetical protein [Tanacetum cinerariifolium]